MAASQWVVDVTAETFQDKVIAESQKRPVVVDFWAPWCGPCRALGPRLEALASEKAGGFLLAKVNVDDAPQVAQAFGVESIPAVFAIRAGKVINHFIGVVPEGELQAFVDGLAPTETETKGRAALELEGRNPKAAAATYREILSTSPDDPVARLGLARVLLAVEGNEAEGRDLLAHGGFQEHAQEATRLRTIIELRETPHSPDDLARIQAAVRANPSDAKARHTHGAVLAAKGDYVPALDVLLEAADLDRALGRGAVRELMVKLFDVIGPQSPEATDYRNRLRLLLY